MNDFWWGSGNTMMDGFGNGFLGGLGGFGLGVMGWFGGLFILVVLWSLFWKGLALWHSARRGEPWWFVAFLVINTLGILEIIYLFLVARVKTERLFSNKEGSARREDAAA